MKKHLKALLIAGIICVPAIAEAKTLIIGLDFSGSSPLSDQAFADRVAQKVVEEIHLLHGGDTIILRSFGLHSSTNTISRDYKLTRRMKSRAVAKVVADFIQSVPKKKLTNEKGTSMLGFLSDMGSVYPDCGKEEVSYLLITDAVEVSSYANIPDIIKRGKGHLPLLKHVDFKGCDLATYGIGRGWDAVRVDALKGLIYTWAEGEKFNRPNLLNNW